MKEMLINREYPKGVIDGAIAKARAIPRQEALRRVPRQHTTSRPTFVVSNDPRLPSISDITRKHWRAMNNQDDYLGSVFPEPPLISYRRQKNIGESIIRAKVAAQRQHRIQRGMKKCGKCLACSYILECKTVRGQDYKGKKFVWKINRDVSCNTKNTIYMGICDKNGCQQKYIGMTQNFRERTYQHVGYVRNKMTSKATGEYFNLPGHSMNNMKFCILEQVRSHDPLYARERERLLIRKFNTFHHGINKEP